MVSVVKQMPKKKTKLKKSTEILRDSILAVWLYVNTDNEFTFEDKKYAIDEKVAEYRVYNKAGEVEDYTNESEMDLVLIVKDTNNDISFYNEKFEVINNKHIKRGE